MSIDLNSMKYTVLTMGRSLLVDIHYQKMNIEFETNAASIRVFKHMTIGETVAENDNNSKLCWKVQCCLY